MRRRCPHRPHRRTARVASPPSRSRLRAAPFVRRTCSIDPMPASPPRRVRIVYYSTWADGLEDATEYLASLPARDLSSKVSDPRDAELMRMARLDCDWDGEVLRAFA